ncbi:hypothetical protein AVEN_154511-1 [Araneus ventricosus]|uniref:Uncharacterized protein n=1 Tax=Araneus ventricosus TaxID=182803 RepID=A0A4Y2HWH2_ARAVE|nr:hypothetical protein AVEN_154511-1 [Araneus ventricosus]
MPRRIENPADCEIRSFIDFLKAKDVKSAEIHRQISVVCQENIMSEGMMKETIISKELVLDNKIKCTSGPLLELHVVHGVAYPSSKMSSAIERPFIETRSHNDRPMNGFLSDRDEFSSGISSEMSHRP